MDIDRQALIEEVQRSQKLVIMAIQQVVMPYWLELELTMAQLKGILTLATSGSTTVSHFATLLRIGRSAASLLVDRLVQDGLVERTEDAQDRRRTLIRLSPRGEDLVAQLRQGRGKLHPLSEWLDHLSKSDLIALAQGLRALATEAQSATGVTDAWQEHNQEADEEFNERK
jgi:DNA-binding MarR family transcriptional regulator